MINLGSHSKQNIALGALLLGLLLSDLIPTPSDALYFSSQKKLKDEVENGEITPKQFWIRDAGGYYLYNSLWWILVIVIIYSMNTSYDTKLKVLFGLLGAGLVVFVIYKNIVKDEELQRIAKGKI